MQADTKRISLPSGPLDVFHVERSGEPIFLIHGYPGRPQDFSRLIEALAEHTIIAVALPGFSTNNTVDIEQITQASFITCCLELLEELSIDRVHIVGHSFGGTLACELAYHLGIRVQSLCLISSVGIRPHRVLRYGIRYMYHIMSVPPFSLIRPWVLKIFFLTAGFPKKLSMDAMWLSCRLVSLFSFKEHKTIVSKLQCKTVIFHSKDDPLIEPKIAEELSQTIPNAKLILLEDGQHNPQHKHSAVVAKNLKEMLGHS